MTVIDEPLEEIPRLTTAVVQTDRTCDPILWRARNRLDEVPDELPYGLNRLVEFGVDPHHLVPNQSLPSRSAARTLRLVGHRFDWWNALAARSVDVDVYICWDERSGVPTALSVPASGPPVATGAIWLTDSSASSTKVRIAVRALKKARAVWALSSAQLPVLRDLGVPAERLHHLPFGIDEGFWSRDRVGDPEPSRRRRRGPQLPTVLGVGNDRDRDHAALLRAVLPLCRDGSARLRLVTNQEVGVPFDLGTRVPALTHAALRAEYAAASVVCVALRPNLHVSGMTTLLEAQAMATPVVATRTPGMEDYVIDQETGLLVEPGDEEAMRSAVASLLADPARAREMGERGRQMVEERANTRHQAAALAEIVRGIV